MRGVTVTLVTVTVSGTDALGNDVYSRSRQDIPSCAFVPEQTSESTQGAEEVIVNAKCYLPAGTVISNLDEIIFNGVTYQVQGDSSTWNSPFTGVSSPVMVNLRVVTGAAAHVSSGSGSGGA